MTAGLADDRIIATVNETETFPPPAPAVPRDNLAPAPSFDLEDPSLYLNRGLAGVSTSVSLEESPRPAQPLLDRVKFIAITGCNLDEFSTPSALDG